MELRRWLLVDRCLAAAAQTPYQPKFKGDPAKSDSEAAALGYMRTVLRAQKDLQEEEQQVCRLACRPGPHRIVYQAHGEPGSWRLLRRLQPNKDGFDLTLTPKQLDAEHRSFYADEDGVIHARRPGPGNGEIAGGEVKSSVEFQWTVVVGLRSITIRVCNLHLKSDHPPAESPPPCHFGT